MSSYGEVALYNREVATYISSDPYFSPVAVAPTDIWEIYGSGSKTIRILSVGVYVGSTAAGYFNGFLLRRSTANTGGTSATTTAAKMDSNNASATAVVKAYTANPTTGTSAGQLITWSQFPMLYNVSGQAEEMGGVPYSEVFNAVAYGQALVLRGTGEGLVLNCNGVANALSAGRVSVRCVWTEE